MNRKTICIVAMLFFILAGSTLAYQSNRRINSNYSHITLYVTKEQCAIATDPIEHAKIDFLFGEYYYYNTFWGGIACWEDWITTDAE